MHKDQTCSKQCAMCEVVFYRDKRNTWVYWGKAKFCSRTCSSRYGAAIKIKKTPTLADAFWNKAIKSEEDKCWSWSGIKDKDGYPLVSFRNKLLRAGRVALIISGVDLKNDHHACHSCGNKWCCNPKHLYAGTAKQNNQDKLRHGTHRSGEAIHFSKLKRDDVLAIRSSSERTAVLAENYNVSMSCIQLIKAGKTWRCLNDANDNT